MSISPWLIEFAEYLEYAAGLVLLVPLALALWRWPRLTPPLRLLAGSLLFTELTVLFSSLVTLYRPGWLYCLWNIYTVVQTLLFLRLYYLTLSSRRLRLALGRVVAPGFVLFALLDLLCLEGPNQVSSYTHVLQSALLIGLALLYFEQLLNELHVVRLEQDPLFLVSTAVVLYFSGTVLVFVFINKLSDPSDHASNQVMNALDAMVNLIKYVLFALAFWYAGRPLQAPAQS
ncbi:hypothetical protein [Hymenobacter algoricola]|uniref:Uncharacterized protein n=1 Tax=Hymenobacter algoricola TaxID=486267 RepID=A0ABP7NER3_9BACT